MSKINYIYTIKSFLKDEFYHDLDSDLDLDIEISSIFWRSTEMLMHTLLYVDKLWLYVFTWLQQD